MLRTLLLSLTAVILSACQPYNMPKGVTETSQQVYDLHMFAFWICVVIGIVVYGIIFFSIIFHRKSRGYQAAKFSHSTKVEIIWTMIPITILVILMIPGIRQLADMHNTGEAELDIKITAYQWKWQYEYIDKNVGFFSNLITPRAQIINQQNKGQNYLLEVDEPLVLPVDTRVRFLITAADVIHAWWVPELSVKRDAVPGFINEAWTEIREQGTYRGQCAELCGTDHGFMPIVVQAVAQEDFDQWLAEQQVESEQQEQLAVKEDWTKDELIQRGEEVYAISCASCHQANGKGIPPAFPALENSPIVLGDIKDQIDIVLNGRSGTAMAAFGSILSDNDIAAVITYTRNSWNHKGNVAVDTVFPADVAAERQ